MDKNDIVAETTNATIDKLEATRLENNYKLQVDILKQIENTLDKVATNIEYYNTKLLKLSNTLQNIQTETDTNDKDCFDVNTEFLRSLYKLKMAKTRYIDLVEISIEGLNKKAGVHD